MTHRFADITFTDSVKAAQDQYGSRDRNQRMRTIAGPNDRLGARESDFIAKRDTFYLATIGETGWPYVQHRGGPAGFLKVLSPTRLAFADFRGNTQLVSVGNVSINDRCSLILMDYPNRHRLKVLGHMSVEAADSVDSDILNVVDFPDYKARVERIVFIDIVAFDWNCPQHITRRYTESEYLKYQEKMSE